MALLRSPPPPLHHHLSFSLALRSRSSSLTSSASSSPLCARPRLFFTLRFSGSSGANVARSRVGVRAFRSTSLAAEAPQEEPDQSYGSEQIQLVLEVKQRLEREHLTLQLGKNGRDDEDMILWFLKDRRFSVEEAVVKLSRAIKWREDFGVSGLSEESVTNLYKTGKAYVPEFPDNNGRPVLLVFAAKHFPGKQDPIENEKLCVFLIEKALRKLSPGTEEILIVMDLRGFRTENADVLFLKFLIDVFYCYYPRRLGQVLFVDAPFVFQPVWQLAKPLLRSYASLVRFCNAETVRTEYFTESTVPAEFKD